MNVEYLPEITAISTFSIDANKEIPVESNFTHSVGSSVRFLCASTGNPLPRVSWSIANKTADEYAHWTEEATESGKILSRLRGHPRPELVQVGMRRKRSAHCSK